MTGPELIPGPFMCSITHGPVLRELLLHSGGTLLAKPRLTQPKNLKKSTDSPASIPAVRVDQELAMIAAPTLAVGGTTDADLLKAISAGRDEEAFAELVRRYGPLVLSVCRRVLADRPVADDAFQAVFLVVAREAGTLRRPEQLGNWLYVA